MKATGIVRRIDDLGRVVIPKEIRRTMRIREGDPLEIFTDHDGEVIFKKYSPIGELFNFASGYCDTLNKSCGLNVAVCDRDSIIACAGISKKEFVDQKLPQELERLIERRQLFCHRSGQALIDLGKAGSYVSVLMPILLDGDIIGAVLSVTDGEGEPTDLEIKLVQTAAAFLAKQLEA
ncbi:MAG: AbrB/MazE/SpoVT family DNA-binding domain-containing protein [Ruminococcaceae bacterium]|nr:AbrB/MazE/SpoVT family DNA-binding domain-containing protein [Oscillospiraceae bacterium]